MSLQECNFCKPPILSNHFSNIMYLFNLEQSDQPHSCLVCECMHVCLVCLYDKFVNLPYSILCIIIYIYIYIPLEVSQNKKVSIANDNGDSSYPFCQPPQYFGVHHQRKSYPHRRLLSHDAICNHDKYYDVKHVIFSGIHLTMSHNVKKRGEKRKT